MFASLVLIFHSALPVDMDLIATHAKGWEILSYANTEQEYTQACDYFEQAAIEGMSISQVQLGNCYMRGDGREYDFDKAIEWYTAAADNNNTSAMLLIGRAYLYQRESPELHRKAIPLLTEAWNYGFWDAGFLLGMAYGCGLGVEKNYEEALNYYELGGNNGDFLSQALLFSVYSEGSYGVTKDPDKAAYWRDLYEQAMAMPERRFTWSIEESVDDIKQRGLGLDCD